MVLSATDQASVDTITRLAQRMNDRNVDLKRFDEYYNGIQGRRFVGTKYRELFAAAFEAYCENFCGLVVDAVEERLDVEGFKFPAEGGAANADTDAWRIWQDNQLDAWSQIAHTEALIKRVSYALVSPFRSEYVGGRSPLITIEDALQTIVEYRSGTSIRIVGMKLWFDEELDRACATLYYPDWIEKWQADGRHTPESLTQRLDAGAPSNWSHREVKGEAWPLKNPLGIVPLVPLVNRPRLRLDTPGLRRTEYRPGRDPVRSTSADRYHGEGESEIAQIIPIQDAINTLALNELVASEAAAFPQKWATGIEIPKDANGNLVEPWKPDIDRILSTKVPDARFGSFEAAQLTQWSDAIDRRIQRIASITRTPYHYFLQHSGQPPSGESLKSAEVGLVRKSRRKMRHFGEGWEEVIRLSFIALEDPRGKVLNSETQWANPESMTEAEHADALLKRRTGLKVPLEILWREAGYTPTEISTFKELLQGEKAMLEGTLVGAPDPGQQPPIDGGPAPAATDPSQPR